MPAVPIALKKDCIYECVFEMRFKAHEGAATDLLPGMVFGALRGWLTRSVPLPFGQLPLAIRSSDPNLLHQPVQALEGDGVKMIFAPKAVGLSFVRPYPGWNVVKSRILEALRAVAETRLVGTVERCSLKYTNVVAVGKDAFDVGQLRFDIKLGDFALSDHGLAVKAEIHTRGCVTIVQASTGAEVKVRTRASQAEASGVLLDVDTISHGPFAEDIGAFLPDVLENLHDTEKEIFFGLLKPETIEKLEPVWK